MPQVLKYVPDQCAPYLALARLDRPVGTLLLLWPTLAAVWLAAGTLPSLSHVVIFTAGTFLMRSAGCVVNDIADRELDGSVKRTRDRPLVTGAVSVRDAWLLFAALVAAAGLLVLFLNTYTLIVALGGLAIAAAYPLMKRWTYLPQVVLGAAFSWGIVMAFAAAQSTVPPEGWLLFVASVTWIVAYDTYYAMVDRDDDIKIGIRSTAILFGQHDRLMIGILQAATVAALLLLGQQQHFSFIYFAAVAVIVGLFAYQQLLTREREREACYLAFRNNIWVGFTLFAGVIAELNLLPLIQALVA